MDPGNRLCSECGQKPAEYLCSCSTLETFLCEEHLLDHKSHQFSPIALLQDHEDSTYVSRLEAFPRVSEEALGSIEQVDRAITELAAKVEKIKAALTTLCTEKVRELQEMRASLTRDIPLALEEVERTLAEKQPLLNTIYGHLFRKRIERAGPLQLFTFTINTGSPQALLSIHSELPSPQDLLPPTTLSWVYRNKAFLFATTYV